METTKKASNIAIADLKAVPFQMKKTLIPIDRYAQKESLTRDIVEQCAKMGLLQIRKCKGEVFVVDTPFDAFGARDEILADVKNQIKQREQVQVPTAKKQPLKQKPLTTAKPVAQTKPAQPTKAVTAVKGKAAPAVKPQSKKPQSYKTVAENITKQQLQDKAVKPKKTLAIEDDEPIRIDEIINTEILSSNKSEHKSENIDLDINEIDELINEKDLLVDYQQSYYNNKQKIIVPQKNWTTAAIISALCLSFSLMCCFWLYLDGQMQRDKISNLRSDNIRLQKSLSTSNKQTAGIREEFAESNRQISELNNQINNLKKELANTKNQLDLTIKQLQQATQNTQ